MEAFCDSLDDPRTDNLRYAFDQSYSSLACKDMILEIDLIVFLTQGIKEEVFLCRLAEPRGQFQHDLICVHSREI